MKQIEKLVQEVKNRKAKKVLLQVPEGLKLSCIKIMNALSDEKIEAVISGERCFGACDIKDEEASMHGCDLVVHIGHSKFYIDFPVKVPVLYFPWNVEVSIGSVDFSLIKEKRIGLVSTIQHVGMLGNIKDLLEKTGREAHIGGQILGCWTENAEKIAGKVDAILYVGSGIFHPTAIRGKKIYRLDIERNFVEPVDLMAIEKRRYANIYHARNAGRIGILVTSKKGQVFGVAEEIKKKLENKDKKASIIIMDEITNDKLEGLAFEAYVNTACPRIAEDHFSKPIVNASDIEEVLA